MEVVAETSRAFIARHFGEQGRAWLATVPETIERSAARWRLEVGAALPGGLLACVLDARDADGRELVLKVASPWDRPRDELACLRAWGGGPAPEIVGADEERGVLLMERIRPGVPALDADAGEVAQLCCRLHVAAPPRLPTLGEIVRRRLAQAVEQGRASRERAARALHTVARLELDRPAPVIVHGDLDERNILRCAVRGVAAIDPLPCAGDPAYDLAYWAHGNGRRGKRQRIDAIARAAAADPARVRRWAAVIAVHG